MSFKQLSLLFCLLISLSCERDEQTPECIANPINFISLTAENDTIEAGMSTRIIALAEGYKLTYEWSATRGYITPIEDKTNEVNYAASPCAIGDIFVTCKITDDCNNSISKDVKIIVL
ncbi:MAG: hypothetical protein AMS27_16305 [Bacteroides sp. SM23_62_1]|nr:MAG: hypothetical protein AMS27_16305 [Bacteroides sp. SM23_62_1]